MDDKEKNVHANETGDGNGSQEQHNTGTPPDKGEHMIPKSRFDQVVNQRKEAESALDEIAAELVEEVPEDMRDLIPDLPAAKKIKWLRAAVKKGIFNGRATGNSPDSKRPGGKPPVDFDNMNPTQMIALGYGQKK
jgi:hypothetical protein